MVEVQIPTKADIYSDDLAKSVSSEKSAIMSTLTALLVGRSDCEREN